MLGMVDFSLIPVYIIDDLTLKHGAASLTDRGGWPRSGSCPKTLSAHRDVRVEVCDSGGGDDSRPGIRRSAGESRCH